MSLQDDIARIANRFRTVSSDFTDYIAAGLEREYWWTKLADLPEVTFEYFTHEPWPTVNGASYSPGTAPAWAIRETRRLIALALHLQSRESEAAALQARRDELVHQYGYELTYDDQSPMVKDLINRLISANADHTRAGEEATS